ncbi:MAG: Ribosomal protein S19 [Candidatus Uhrbacteria bacterium GW2011_GWF2_41_16]|uniref:Small ribosomal subunit protein uS19 n=2 Tax=Candidatus Uhriibacteriota TaxID=1752732 RepID=A0A0G0YDV8_9BACT|nr:MAG: Ribosomal protein S19 [Candidatus Uhrbacteria bacterium GW2011_GWA2_41_10]KKR87522.1 MAG: Ribosomal protein S19 [Candidatus Uhrbacteria bacterium GW2011_GWC2_41_11]KKR98502.1 MAG: Ribosomal protein S19 [Candidatus Uhrbacteria bacterium GW2011_GWF2_41_16]
MKGSIEIFSHMSRSSKKGPYIDQKLVLKIQALSPGSKTVVKTWSRAATITPEMVGFTIGVHNGKEHISVRVVEEMVGHKLGEFSPTRRFVRHGGKIQKAAETAVSASAPSAPSSGKSAGKK